MYALVVSPVLQNGIAISVLEQIIAILVDIRSASSSGLRPGSFAQDRITVISCKMNADKKYLLGPTDRILAVMLNDIFFMIAFLDIQRLLYQHC
jgi:hypothetical protein